MCYGIVFDRPNLPNRGDRDDSEDIWEPDLRANVSKISKLANPSSGAQFFHTLPEFRETRVTEF